MGLDGNEVRPAQNAFENLSMMHWTCHSSSAVWCFYFVANLIYKKEKWPLHRGTV